MLIFVLNSLMFCLGYPIWRQESRCCFIHICVRSILPGVSWKSFPCPIISHHNSCFGCSDNPRSISGSVLSGSIGQVGSSSALFYCLLHYQRGSRRRPPPDYHNHGIFRLFFQFSGMIISYITSVLFSCGWYMDLDILLKTCLSMQVATPVPAPLLQRFIVGHSSRNILWHLPLPSS